MKITKKIKIKNCDSLRLFKRERSKYWYAGIVVPRTVKKNCFLFKSLRFTIFLDNSSSPIIIA